MIRDRANDQIIKTPKGFTYAASYIFNDNRGREKDSIVVGHGVSLKDAKSDAENRFHSKAERALYSGHDIALFDVRVCGCA